MVTPVAADIERARDLMEDGKFVEAKEALWPAARSGNADAEELIGVMYAMGLGVERDDVRAFEWYLRSSLKGHPGAQSGIGWYYEVGRGLPAPDLVRAYMWYTLSAIGGDPDAAISLEEVVKKMTPEQIEKAHTFINRVINDNISEVKNDNSKLIGIDGGIVERKKIIKLKIKSIRNFPEELKNPNMCIPVNK